MKITEQQIEKLKLTVKQLEATKAVYKAMKKAGSLGVSFFDNYGTLTAYNAKKIEVPIMTDNGCHSEKLENSDDHFQVSNCDGEDVLYYENLKNFFAGNADDTFYAKVI